MEIANFTPNWTKILETCVQAWTYVDDTVKMFIVVVLGLLGLALIVVRSYLRYRIERLKYRKELLLQAGRKVLPPIQELDQFMRYTDPFPPRKNMK